MSKREVGLIIFYNGDGEILLQERGDRSKFGENWGFFGGGIEEGEELEEAVIRETEEELSYKLEDFKYVGSYKSTFEGKTAERYIFTSEIGDKLTDFDQKEGKDMNFFSIEKARDLKMMPGDKTGIELIEKYLDEIQGDR